jgi:hypothetical protein
MNDIETLKDEYYIRYKYPYVLPGSEHLNDWKIVRNFSGSHEPRKFDSIEACESEIYALKTCLGCKPEEIEIITELNL